MEPRGNWNGRRVIHSRGGAHRYPLPLEKFRPVVSSRAARAGSGNKDGVHSAFGGNSGVGISRGKRPENYGGEWNIWVKERK